MFRISQIEQGISPTYVMLKTNLILVESPLQLLNAYEAIHFFGLKKYRMIVRYSSVEKNDLQMARLLKILDFNLCCVEYITIKSSKRNLLDLVKFAFYRSKFLFGTSNIERLFVGNYSSGFFSLIYSQFKKKQIILLDDGSRTLEIQKTFSDKSSIDLFTMFDIAPYTNQNVHHNSFAKIQIKLTSALEVQQSSVLFLGSGLAEINIITSSEYINLIAKIVLHYKARDQKVFYIPHRSENYDKVRSISEMPNLEVVNIDYPIELYGIFERKVPATIASFYSTALVSMRNIYGLRVECFKFNYENSKHKHEIDSVYDHYEKEMNVISLVD